MKALKWLVITLSFIAVFLAIIVSFNFCEDTYGVGKSLFAFDQDMDINYRPYQDAINQHIFNPEYIFRHPDRYNSFIFGSSRVAVINPAKINKGNFYNMSYSQGLPSQHSDIIKAFLHKGIKIKTVLIGLDEFCFSVSAEEHKDQLIRIMHPDISGPSRMNIFFLYFFRKPQLFELAHAKDKLFHQRQETRFMLDRNGLNLGWLNKDKIISTIRKPIFSGNIPQYAPITYLPQEVDGSIRVIEDLINLSKINNFSLILFFNPINAKQYLNHANQLMSIKERLARITDYYDFSGFNSITTNDINYYEESHYRYLVGDLIIKRIFDQGNQNIPQDFGILVTKKNIRRHIENEKRELAQYLARAEKRNKDVPQRN
jgi:hypothetical protein